MGVPSVTDPDPGSGTFLSPWIRDSGLTSPDHISDSLETIFWFKYLNSLKRMRIRESSFPWIRDGKNSDPGQTSRIRNTGRTCNGC